MIPASAITYALKVIAKQHALELFQFDGLLHAITEAGDVRCVVFRAGADPADRREIHLPAASFKGLASAVAAIRDAFEAAQNELRPKVEVVEGDIKPPNDDLASLKKHLADRFRTTSDPVTDALYLISGQLDEVLAELRARR